MLLPLSDADRECVGSSGTLVLILPVQNGLVACADRREWNRIEGPKDDVKKLHLLGERAVFVVSGSNGIVAPAPNGELTQVYSLTDSIQAFYRDRDVQDFDQDWTALSTTLRGEFELAHEQRGLSIQPPPGARDDVVWEVEFVYLRNGIATAKRVMYRTNGEIAASELPRKPYITGQTDVVLRILRPGDYPDGFLFSDLQGNPQIARAWNFSAPGYPAGVNPEDALVLARTFIRASAERMHLVTQTPALVGPTFDCVLFREDSETVEWLETGP